MAGFSIDSSVASQSSTKNRLEGNAIHTVKFKGVEAKDLKEGEYKVLNITFENEKGEFTDTIFPPREVDFDRRVSDKGYESPSAVEEMMAKFRHLIAAVNPELDKQIENKTKNLNAPDWDGLRKLVVAATKKGIDKELQIKLINNGKGEPKFPGFFLGLSKANQVYIRTNFIGQDLQFTPKEKERIANMTTAKPQNVKNTSADKGLDDEVNTGTSATADDLDFDVDDL